MKIKELYSSPEKWCQGVSARDRHGYPTHCKGDKAVAWCLIGAIMKCYPADDNQQADRQWDVFKRVYARIGDSPIGQWNDSHTFEEVLALVIELDI